MAHHSKVSDLYDALDVAESIASQVLRNAADYLRRCADFAAQSDAAARFDAIDILNDLIRSILRDSEENL